MARDANVERIAETHYFIRPQIVKTLSIVALAPEAKVRVGDYDTYLELWEGSFADRFFDMSTIIRLATAIETGLRHLHCQFTSAPKPGNLYQRLIEPTDIIATLKADCSYDLASNPAWGSVRQIMAHGHLYAHRSGLVDESYIKHMQAVPAVDIRPIVDALGYPEEDVYWFEPLKQLSRYIEETRVFFRALPEIGSS
jgi:hypothetical protein